MPDYYEFFAGGGMVRAGLGSEWNCLFANDFDYKKSRVYRDNWGDGKLKTEDVGALKTSDITGRANLAWASFPCQDLSLAGAGAGLKGERSGTFWPFWHLMKALIREGRGSELIVLENVPGTLTSHDGKDFTMICRALQSCDYRVGAVIIDAVLFVPQSRPRLFIIAVHKDLEIPANLIAAGPLPRWHNKTLKDAYAKLPTSIQENWIWWNLPNPRRRKVTLSDLIEENPDVEWFTESETDKLLSMMSETNRVKLDKAKQMGQPIVGGVYKRTRKDEDGKKCQRAEIRFDNLAGCLRTPAGGSSRQIILVVNGDSVRARLISTRETARLMGLRESYKLPKNYNEAYHLTGDGVVVPVVRHLAKNILEPILNCLPKSKTMAA
jgi:DNA (cytosine-5)-methyltransferase 1